MNVIWSENSTKRGLIKGLGCLIALGFLWFQDTEKAMFVLTIFGIAGNAHGIITPDKPE